MELRTPFIISPGLYPGLKIDNATLECREALQFAIVFDDGHEHLVNDFRPGAFADLQSCFAAMLSFLSAWSDALHYGPESDNYTLFPAEDTTLSTWAQSNSDDLAMLNMEIEESDNLIIE